MAQKDERQRNTLVLTKTAALWLCSSISLFVLWQNFNIVLGKCSKNAILVAFDKKKDNRKITYKNNKNKNNISRKKDQIQNKSMWNQIFHNWHTC